MYLFPHNQTKVKNRLMFYIDAEKNTYNRDSKRLQPGFVHWNIFMLTNKLKVRNLWPKMSNWLVFFTKQMQAQPAYTKFLSIIFDECNLFSFLVVISRQILGLIFWTYFTPPILQSSAFLISDRYCHHKSNNYIIILIEVGPRI